MTHGGTAPGRRPLCHFGLSIDHRALNAPARQMAPATPKTRIACLFPGRPLWRALRDIQWDRPAN
ncbi:hypothetical protein IL54_1897 [Sphingobium sp. ba1]|nr:hypothetical protein IL54_1897 [Sphingobium sp. ba1]